MTAWTHPRADAGATGFLDVEPVLRPRLRWVARDAAPDARASLLLASPKGIAVRATRGKETRLAVLDPDTGERRWDAAWHAPAWGGLANAVIQGDTLLAKTGERYLAAHDLGTGDVLHGLSCDPDGLRLATPGLLIVAKEGKLAALACPDPRRPPEASPLAFTLPPSQEPGQRQPPFYAGGGLVLAQRTGTHAFSRETGAHLWFSPDLYAPLVDQGDPIARVADLSSNRAKLAAVDAKGATRWEAFAVPHVLLPDAVIASQTDLAPATRHLVALARATGERRELAAMALGSRACVAAARGAVYGWFEPDDQLRALAPDGRPLWALGFRDLLEEKHRQGWITDLAVLPGRLLARTSDGTVFCLVEGE